MLWSDDLFLVLVYNTWENIKSLNLKLCMIDVVLNKYFKINKYIKFYVESIKCIVYHIVIYNKLQLFYCSYFFANIRKKSITVFITNKILCRCVVINYIYIFSAKMY